MTASVADAQLVPDGPVGQPTRGQAQDVQFPICEGLDLAGSAFGTAAHRLPHHLGGNLWAEGGFPPVDGAHGAHQLIPTGGLEHVAVGPGLEKGEHVGVIVVGGEDEHPHLGKAVLDLARSLHAGHRRHADIEHRHVRTVFFDQAQRLCAIVRLSDHRDVTGLLQELADALAHDGVVVGQDDADRIPHNTTPSRCVGLALVYHVSAQDTSNWSHRRRSRQR